MINLKKLAMISAMGMVLSTGAMATEDGQEVTLDVDPATITVDSSSVSQNFATSLKKGDTVAVANNQIELKYSFKADNVYNHDITFTLPTEESGKLILVHTQDNTKKIKIPMALKNINGDDNPTELVKENAVADFYVHSSGDSDEAAPAEGSYSVDYTVKLVYQ